MIRCQLQKENSYGKWQKTEKVFSMLKCLLLPVPTLTILFAMLGAWACRFIAPSEFMPIAYLGLGFPLILVVYLIWIIVLLIFGAWRQLLLLIPTLICLPIMLDTFPINLSKSEVDANAKTFKLLTYNVGAFRYRENATSKIADLIQQDDYDIICLQEYIEFRARENEDFRKLLSIYPYSTVGDMSVDSHNRVVTLSKHKIIKSGVASKGKGNNRAIYSDIVIGNDTIRVINAHLASNHISYADKQEIDSISHGLKVEKVKDKIHTLDKKVTNNYVIREQMANDIDSVIAITKSKVMVCGDFNDVPVSYVYHKIKGERFSVANEELGWGYSYTFRESPFYFCIDHILYQTDGFCCLDYKRLKVPYSDHYPSMVQFSIKQ
ncbi:MAG: endonuclease/exonuclease/phosphatase family protein [Paludibacteraceae bacterium]|nr:endonuclease/exonuclease/phosphatase family protein [Paludibacteraceae bacterium]